MLAVIHSVPWLPLQYNSFICLCLLFHLGRKSLAEKTRGRTTSYHDPAKSFRQT